MFTKNFFLMIAVLIMSTALSQTAEYYIGNQRFGIDLMWFKNFKKKNNEKSSLLYFSRNRASVGYKSSQPLIGSTNALSYNFKNGIGFVTVLSFTNYNLSPKTGIQFFKQKNEFMFFGWFVTDLVKNGSIDFFGLFRYQLKINDDLKIYNQLEIFPTFKTNSRLWNLTERIRLGLKHNQFSYGLITDLNQLGTSKFINTANFGVFLRYEF